MNLLLALVAAARVASAEPATLQDMQVTAKQVTLKLSRQVGYRGSTTANPPAVVITLEDTRIAPVVQEKSVASALVAGIATIPLANAEGDSARVVIKLAKRREFAAAFAGNDLIIDLVEPAGAEAAAPAARPAAPPAAGSKAAPDTVPETVAPKTAPKKVPRFLVQVGVFTTEAAADELKKDLDTEEGPTLVRKVEIGGKTMYRVLVGPPRNRAAALAFAEKLKALGHSGLLYKE